MALQLREDLKTNIEDIMKSEDDDYLAEAQERMYKAESKATWEYFQEICDSIKLDAKKNVERI